jgi:prepilin-type N-terminal cleavage/methylation domain-containing protein
MYQQEFRKSVKGFTLIELLIVLAVITISSTIVVPKLWGQYSQFQERKQLVKFWSQIKGDSNKRRQHGKNYVFDPQSEKMKEFAADSQVEINAGDIIIVRADDFTRGGSIMVKLKPSDHQWIIQVSTPDGHVRFERR